MFYPKSYIFCELKPHAKFQNTTKTPSWRKVTETEERREREKTPLIVDTWFHDSERKPLGPIHEKQESLSHCDSLRRLKRNYLSYLEVIEEDVFLYENREK